MKIKLFYKILVLVEDKIKEGFDTTKVKTKIKIDNITGDGTIQI